MGSQPRDLDLSPPLPPPPDPKWHCTLCVPFAGLAALLPPVRWAAAADDSNGIAVPEAQQQQEPSSGAPAAEGGALPERSPVPLTPEELERQAAAKLLEVCRRNSGRALLGAQ